MLNRTGKTSDVDEIPSDEKRQENRCNQSKYKTKAQITLTKSNKSPKIIDF